jgi:hypothetical protein
MKRTTDLTEEELGTRLAYAGMVLVAFELVKSMIVGPIKAFYSHTTFTGSGMPFRSYEEDVLSRHKDQFQACLLYLRDFMEAIDDFDIIAIQSLRKHRNELAHDLVQRLPHLDLSDHKALFMQVEATIFKLSNYRAYIEIGSDPDFQKLKPDWTTLKGHEYLIFEDVMSKLKMFG